MDYIDVSGKTKEEAIIKASMELKTPSDELDIDVLSEGSKGFLGFGSKPFVIRAKKRQAEKTEEVEKTEEAEETVKEEAIQPKITATSVQEPIEEFSEKKVPEQKPLEQKVAEEKASEQHRAHRPRKEARKIEVLTDNEQIEEAKKKAEAFLSDVFQAMGILVQMESVYNKEDGSLTIDFSGESMGILIGKRGQTLDSLQYLTGLVLNKGKSISK